MFHSFISQMLVPVMRKKKKVMKKQKMIVRIVNIVLKWFRRKVFLCLLFIFCFCFESLHRKCEWNFHESAHATNMLPWLLYISFRENKKKVNL